MLGIADVKPVAEQDTDQSDAPKIVPMTQLELDFKQGGLPLTTVDRPPRAADQAGLDDSGRIISPALDWDAETDAGP